MRRQSSPIESARSYSSRSSFAFNAGVEIRQACIVAAVAPWLIVLHRHSRENAERVVVAGSWLVSAAGACWLVQRIMALLG